MKAIKKNNNNGTFRFELENGEVIVKRTKKEYNAFALTYTEDFNGNKCLFVCGSTTKGAVDVSALAQRNGNKEGSFFIVTI